MHYNTMKTVAARIMIHLLLAIAIGFVIAAAVVTAGFMLITSF